MPNLASSPRNLIPVGFPLQLEGPLVWTGSDLKQRSEEYIWELDLDEIQAIETAVRYFKGLEVDCELFFSCEVPNLSFTLDLNVPRGCINKSIFPLPPKLSAKLKRVSSIVHDGHGFVVLRGLLPTKYSREDNILIYVGVTTHVAEKRTWMRQAYNRVQRREGERLPPNLLPGPMSFHTDVDSGDMLSLFTPNISIAGGAQYFASFWKIYNVLAQTDPEVLALLAENWRFEMPFNDSGGVEIIERPVIYCVDGKVEITFGRAFLTRSRSIEKSTLPPEKARAVDTLMNLCQEFCVKHTPSRGDILFANNLSLLHARDDFQDDALSGKSRHLIGLLHHDPDMAWPQPKAFEGRVKSQFEHPRDDFQSILQEWEQYIPGDYGPTL